MFLYLKNICKSFENHGKKELVLKNIRLRVEKGEFVSLLGPSGCGKSTLLSIIAGLEKPTDGAVYLDEKPVIRPGKDRGMVFQQAALFPWLTVEENICFPLRKEMKKKEALAVAHKYLELVQLRPYAKYHPHELSGGMQQRVAIARALAMDPEVLLMDEPFSALDEQTRMMLQQELENIWMETRKTIIFVTHSIQEAITLSDRIIVMGRHPGRIIKEFSVNIPRPRNEYLHEFSAYEKEIIQLLKLEIEKKEEVDSSYAVSS